MTQQTLGSLQRDLQHLPQSLQEIREPWVDDRGAALRDNQWEAVLNITQFNFRFSSEYIGAGLNWLGFF